MTPTAAARMAWALAVARCHMQPHLRERLVGQVSQAHNMTCRAKSTHSLADDVLSYFNMRCDDVVLWCKSMVDVLL